ncbi:MAG: sulfurtransferase, partial [Gammaproteobacteria bacterium]
MPASALFETFKPPLVSCEWLSANLNRQDLALFDATFYLPRQNRSGFQEYRQGHLPGALFFDIDAVADLESPLPHTLPSPGKFGRMMGEFGVDDLSTVVVYDDNAFFASARAWWMFRVFGHDRVFVLDGGLRRWKALNLPLQSEIPKPAAKKFISRFRPHLFCDLERMKKNCASGEFLIVDSRSAESYHGRNLPGGSKAEPSHIPGSINVPYAELR